MEYVKTLVSESIAKRFAPIWGINDEGELNSVFRYSGVSGLYFAMGKHQDAGENAAYVLTYLLQLTSNKPASTQSCLPSVSIQSIRSIQRIDCFFTEIKAQEEGLFGNRYSAQD